MARTISLLRTGLIQNISKCYISSNEIQTLPELLGSLQTELGTLNIYLPSKVPVITDYETRRLEDVIPADTKKLNDINSRVTAQEQTYDIDYFICTELRCTGKGECTGT